MQQRRDLLPRGRLQTRQETATADEVHVPEWQVAEQVVPCEQDHLPQLRGYPVSMPQLQEEAVQATASDRLAGAPWKHARAPDLQSALVRIRGEQLHVCSPLRRPRLLEEEHGHGVRLGTPPALRKPHAQRTRWARAVQEPGDDDALDEVPRLRWSKERRPAREECRPQADDLVSASLQE